MGCSLEALEGAAMMEDHSSSDDMLRLFIAYEGYLNADQMATVLTSLDRIYSSLLSAYDFDVNSPLPDEARIRISEARTGQSILFELTQGIVQIWNPAEASINLVDPVGIMATLSTLITTSAALVKLRNSWIRATGEAEKLHAQAARLRAEAEKLEAQAQRERSNRDRVKRRSKEQEPNQAFDISRVPVEYQQEAFNQAFQLLHYLEYQRNITQVRVNHEAVITRDNG